VSSRNGVHFCGADGRIRCSGSNTAISEMDLVTRKVSRGGRALELTVREFEILE